jgi:hypothetical protein
MWARTHADTVEDLGDLEVAEFEAIDLRAQHTQHGCRSPRRR